MKSILTRFCQVAFGIYATLIFLLAVPPTILLLLLIPGLALRRAVTRSMTRLVFYLWAMKPRVVGLGNLPAEGCIVVANHASYLDGVLLTGALPARFSFVIKREVTAVPVMHFLLRRIGSEFLERNQRAQNSQDSRRLLRMAQNRQSMVFFPEGTFAREPGLRPFRNGAFAAAVRGNMPIVPVVIRGTRRALPQGAWQPVWSALEVQVLARIETAGLKNPRAALLAARAQMLAHLGEPDLASPAPAFGDESRTDRASVGVGSGTGE